MRVNGRRLKEGPYSTEVHPARLDPAQCVTRGSGTRGAEPGEPKVLTIQLVNELAENMTACGPPPRTKWTRRVPHPVLIGHAASLAPY